MAFAGNVELVAVTGQFVDYQGTAIAGQVKFKLLDTLLNPSGDQIVAPSSYTATLDANGAFSVQLPATNDVDLNGGAGFTYTVEESFSGGTTYQISVPYRVNLHANPSLETNTTGYALEGSSTITRVNTDAQFGSWSLRATLANTATTTNNVATFNTNGNRVAVSPSTTYTVSAYVKLTSGSGSFRVRTVEYNVNSGGTVIAEGTSTAVALTTSSGWTRLSRTITTDPGTTFLVFKVECSSGAASQVLLIDGVMCEQGSTLGSYFDGSFDGTWSGTAHASTSIAAPDLADLRPAVSITPYIALASGGQYNSLNSRVTTQEGLVNVGAGTVTGSLAYAAVPFIYSTYTAFESAFATYSAMAAGTVPLTLAQTQAIQTYLEAMVVATPTPPGALRRNLVDNPSFEVDTAGWTNTSNCTVARVTTDYYAGSASLQLSITSTTASVTAPAPTLYPTVTNYRSLVTAGTTYTASYRIKATSGTPTFRATINWYDSAGSLLSSSNGTATATTTSWAARSVSAAAPANSAYAAVVIDGTVTANTNVVLVDAVLLEAQSSALAYFDGSTPGAFWLPASAAGSTESVLDVNYRQNLVSNPSVEVDTTGWGNAVNCTLSRSLTQSYVGYTSLAATISNTTAASFYSTVSSVTAGQFYYGNVYVLSSVARNIRIDLTWQDASGATINTSTGGSIASSTSAWTRIFTFAAASAKANSVRFVLNVAAGAAADVHYFDGMQLEQASSFKGVITAPTYVSGLYARDAAQAEQAIATEKAAIVTALIGSPLASDYYPHPFAIPISS